MFVATRFYKKSSTVITLKEVILIQMLFFLYEVPVCVQNKHANEMLTLEFINEGDSHAKAFISAFVRSSLTKISLN